jgi:tripartite-type tricarboxylate transporter receptor subunit TctC
MKLLRTRAFVVAVATMLAQSAFGQAFPARPVRLVIPFPPGSGSELVYRPMTDHMTRTFGQNVLIEPRPGGASMVASLFVKSQPADGYTLYAVSPSVVVKSVIPNAQIDIRKDFTPIAWTNYSPLVLTVNAEQIKARNLRELLEEARARPGQLNYGSYGVGSGAHVFMELVLTEAKVKMVHIPFQGAAQATAANASGEVQVNAGILASLRPFLAETGGSGKLRVIGVTTTERWSLVPNGPSTREVGFPDLDISAWGGVVGPAGMPREIVDRLNQALNAAIKDKEVIEIEAKLGQVGKGGTPEDFARQISREFDTYVRLIRDAGLKLE